MAPTSQALEPPEKPPRFRENVEFHLLDGGHFALESHGAFIATEILDFLDREVVQK